MKSFYWRLPILTTAAVLVASLVVSAGAQTAARRAQRPQDGPPARLVFSIPVGGRGVNYGGVGLREVETWGPASFRIARDGTFLITDTVTNRVLRFDRNGRMLPPLTLREADGITDAVKGESDVYVLDGAAPDPTVIRLRERGQEVERFPVEAGARPGLSGLSVGEDGEALLELYGGATILGPRNQPMRPLGSEGRDISVTIPNQGGGLEDQSEGAVRVDGRTVATVRVANILGGLSVLATTPEGDVYVLVDELTSTPDILIDQTVRHYRADGTLVGVARVPVGERLTYVSHGVAIGPDRQAYALITRARRADVIRLEFEPGVPEILPARPAAPSRPAPPVGAARCRRTRAEMRAVAEAYINNRTLLKAANLTGPCTHRQRPTYLKAVESSYVSVPYDWGGFDSVSTYNDFMNSTRRVYKAGDRKEGFEARNYTANCSRGVDCSGFVSRCWGLAAKEGTGSLPRISTVIRVADLQTGDILNRAGKHVVIFDRLARNPRGGPEQGLYVWESTQTNRFDRVVYHWWPWSRFRGYMPRRYRYVCP